MNKNKCKRTSNQIDMNRTNILSRKERTSWTTWTDKKTQKPNEQIINGKNKQEPSRNDKKTHRFGNDPEQWFLFAVFFLRGDVLRVSCDFFCFMCLVGCLFLCLFVSFVLMFWCKICILVSHCDVCLIVVGSVLMVKLGSCAMRFCFASNFIFMFGYCLYLFVAILLYRFWFVCFLVSCF